MMCNLKKRLLSLTLVLIMLLTYIPVSTTAAESATDIKAIEKPTGWTIVEDYDDYFGDNWVEALDLPKSVKVTLANGTQADVAVTWDTSVIDTRTTGYYSVPGEMMLPSGATNGKELKATITVQVAEAENLLYNPSFEEGANGNTGWHGGKTTTKNTLAAHITDGASSLLKTASASSSNVQVNFQYGHGNDPASGKQNYAVMLAEAIKNAGAGQYYFSYDAKSGNDASNSGLRFGFEILTKPAFNGTSKTVISVKDVTLPGMDQAFAIASGIFEMDGEAGWVRTDMKVYGSAGSLSNLAVYIDNAKLIPLKVALQAEPAGIASIQTEILSRSVVVNYPDYVGENWKDALGLPKKVEVLTDAGTIAEIDVKWSYAGLDFTKYGKYTLTGTLDDGSFPNPNGLAPTVNIYVGKANNLLYNGSFEEGNLGWGGSGTVGKNEDPAHITNGVYSFMKTLGNITSTNTQLAYQARHDKDPETTNYAVMLAEAMKAAGAGQYYISYDAKAIADKLENEYSFGIIVRTKPVYTDSALTVAGTSEQVALPTSNDKFATTSLVFDYDGVAQWVRTDLMIYGTKGTLAGLGVYLDNAQLFALNVTIPAGQEPADVVKVTTEIPVRAVVKDYDKYMGAGWKSSLGLPETVTVLTSGGNTASVPVEWNFDTLNLQEEGKYTLVGTLDTSTYPNPDEIFVTQTIRVRDYKNIIPNSSMENNLAGWYIRGANPSASCVKGISVKGIYSAITGAMVTTGTMINFANNKDIVSDLGAAVALQGAGQYYFSAWAMQASNATVPGMQFEVRLTYKTADDEGVLSSDTIVRAPKVDLDNKNFVQSNAIVDLPDNVATIGLNLYAYAQSSEDINNTRMYFDYAELIPLNVIVEQYEGEMVQVETIVGDRQIIQNYPDYIGEGYTTADLMLPETVDVKTSAGQIIKVDVKWDYSNLNLTKVGKYTIHGVLDDLKIANPNALTVQLDIVVAAKQNLFTNPSFEKDGFAWKKRTDASVETGITNPVHSGDFALLFESGRMDGWTSNQLQSFYNDYPAEIGQLITKTGAGRYYFGGWAQGTASTTDIQVQLRMLYRSLENGDAAITTRGPAITLSTTAYSQMGAFVNMPGDVYWARMDFYLLGTPAQMRLSEVYLDDFELIPLNVEIPNLTDIIDCEGVADIYVHEGSSVEDLKLPEALRIVLKNGQKFNLGVTWDTGSYNPNKVGEQVITGSLNIGDTYRNPKNFTPTARIIVREKGEDLRQTIYLSTSGSEDNDGLSPESPKSDVTKIVTYLRQGYNVSLKRGDHWYVPTYCYNITGIYGTEDAPLVVGAYGSGDAKPVITFAKKIDNGSWRLVDEKRNVYASDVSELGQQFGFYVHRCYVNGESFTVKERSTYIALDAGEFCSYDGMLYVRMPAGETPKNVEATPFKVGNRVYIESTSYLTFDNIHFRCTGAINNLFYVMAPTKHLRFMNCNMTHVYGHVMMWESDDEQIHDKPEVGYCYMDTSFSEADGSIREGYWKTSSTEGVTIRDGADGFWFHHNHMIGFSHAFLAVESLTPDEDYTTTGVRNSIFEDNLMEGGYAKYARAVTLSGCFNLSGVQMCRDNIFRRNRCYDMTTAGHFFGENNLVYSNLISYVHCNYTEDGELFDGKTAQPYGFDTNVYNGKGSVGNMLINNTFFNVGGALSIKDTGGGVYNNLYANNLIVNWTSDTAANGAIYDSSVLMQYVMNNGVYSTIGLIDHFVVDGKNYTAEEANNAVAGYSGNISADPKFVDADLSQMQHGARLEFTLSSDSPMRYAGLSLYNSVYKSFPAWEKLMADYTDINGVVYLAESPSIGAYSFCERISGDVAEVGQVESILARPGTISVDQLNLPDAVPAVNDEGIEVMLLTEWNTEGVDFSKVGTVTLTATLRNGPHTDLNINGKVATIDIHIKDKLELLNVSSILKDITVLYGTSYEDVLKQLPAMLDVMEESGFQESLPVTWSCETYNPTKPSAYTFKCVLPADMLTNAKEFPLSVEVRVLHEIGRGMELLVNADFTDGASADPWKIGWGTGSYKLTTDPQYLYPGESVSAIVTMAGRYGSLQQDVVGQMQLMGNGQYLFKMYMRAYNPSVPIDSSVAALKVFTPTSYTILCRTKNNITDAWVEYSSIMEVYNVEQAAEIMFHTSTYKSDKDAEEAKSYVIAGCSLIYLGNTAAEVEATLDSIDLDWNMIKGGNGLDKSNVTADLELPTSIGYGSKITWTSSDETAITNDGKVTMGRTTKTVTMTATITYNGVETIKKFTVTVPRNADLPTFTGSLSGDQAVMTGEEFKVTISQSSDKAEAFNGYRYTLSFNASKLEYVGISDPTASVEIDGGKLVIYGIGAERPITDTVTVTFKALKSGITEVKLVKLEMDMDSDVTLETLPVMNVVNGAAVIDVQKITQEKDETAEPAEEDSSLIWIIIGIVVAAALIVVLVVIIIKKKRAA